MAAFGAALRAGGPAGISPLAAASTTLAPVLHAVAALPEEQRRAFRKGLARFTRLYTFLSQICRLFDEEMLLFFFFAKKLAAALPPEDDGLVDLDGKIDLAFYRLTKTGERDIPLTPSASGFSGIKDGTDTPPPKEFTSLSDIVDKFNQRFGTTFTPAEQVKHFAQLQKSVLDADTRLTGLAEPDSRPTWDMVYRNVFQTGADMALRHGSPSFRDLLSTPDALDFLCTLMRENIWQQAVARRRELEQGRGC